MGLLPTIGSIGLLYGPYDPLAFYTGLRIHGPSTGRRNAPSMGRIINGPYTGRMIDWLNMGQTDHIMAVNGLELESSVHGLTITGHR